MILFVFEKRKLLKQFLKANPVIYILFWFEKLASANSEIHYFQCDQRTRDKDIERERDKDRERERIEKWKGKLKGKEGGGKERDEM